MGRVTSRTTATYRLHHFKGMKYS